jgi:membrane protease YdiL (CAAX protease family)
MLTPHPRPANGFDHAFAFVLALAFPLFAKLVVFPGLLAGLERGVPDARSSTYLMTIAIQWGLVALLAFVWWRLGRGAASLGLSMPRGWRLAVAVALPAVAVALTVLQSQALAARPELLEQARAEAGNLVGLLPHTPRELRLFIALAITAGVCEELLYRGFLVGYAARFMHPIAAVLVTAAVFGFGHLYQGIDGVIQTGIAGLIAGAMYLVTRSIWPLMLVHAIVDIGGGWVGYRIAAGG